MSRVWAGFRRRADEAWDTGNVHAGAGWLRAQRSARSQGLGRLRASQRLQHSMPPGPCAGRPVRWQQHARRWAGLCVGHPAALSPVVRRPHTAICHGIAPRTDGHPGQRTNGRSQLKEAPQRVSINHPRRRPSRFLGPARGVGGSRPEGHQTPRPQRRTLLLRRPKLSHSTQFRAVHSPTQQLLIQLLNQVLLPLHLLRSP